MDRNTLIGLVIAGAILFGFTWYNTKEASKQAEQERVEQTRRDSIVRANAPAVEPMEISAQEIKEGVEGLIGESVGQQATAQPEPKVDVNQPLLTEDVELSREDARLQDQFGRYLFDASRGEEQLYEVENDLMKITFSSKGGKVVGVELKEYTKYGSDQLVQLYAPGSAQFDMSLFLMQDQRSVQVNSEEYYFTSNDTQVVELDGGKDQVQQLSMRLYVGEGAYIEHLYTVSKSDYMIDFDVNFVNMKGMFANQTDMLFSWGSVSEQNEKGFANENTYTTVAYKFPGDDSVEDLGMSKETKSERISSRVQWVAFKQQFFSTIFIPDNNFLNADLKFDTFIPSDEKAKSPTGSIKKFSASMSVPFSNQTSEYGFKFYFGPNKYSTLNDYNIGIERLVPLGWGIFGWVNRWLVIPVFDFLGSKLTSYGLIILLLTILVKLIILPLTYKSYLSMAKMRLLKPQIDEIGAKFPKQEDAMKKQQATMALYKSAGVNPMGGCLPMLIQMPILIALFRFFPASIELRGQSFLWADDLSSFDSVLNLPFNIPFYGAHVSLFALLMAGAMFFSSKINYTQQASSAPQMAGMKFMMLYMMPVMMLLWFNNYASGLCYYYFLSMMITVAQTYGMRYVVNDEKLFARMKETAANKKPKKQSKWQQRYGEMVKAQQIQQQAQQKKAAQSKKKR